jgi:hypothetical protein
VKRLPWWSLLVAGSVALSAGPAAAQDDAARELLRDRVEAIQAGTRTEIRGTPIAATRALPRLYERRGFATAWTPEKVEQLLAAIHDAEADGLDPADYHLGILDGLKRGDLSVDNDLP